MSKSGTLFSRLQDEFRPAKLLPGLTAGVLMGVT
jgi:hypothetical protein